VFGRFLLRRPEEGRQRAKKSQFQEWEGIQNRGREAGVSIRSLSSEQGREAEEKGGMIQGRKLGGRFTGGGGKKEKAVFRGKARSLFSDGGPGERRSQK